MKVTIEIFDEDDGGVGVMFWVDGNDPTTPAAETAEVLLRMISASCGKEFTIHRGQDAEVH